MKPFFIAIFVIFASHVSMAQALKPLYKVGEKVYYLKPTSGSNDYLPATIVKVVPYKTSSGTQLNYMVKQPGATEPNGCLVEEDWLFKTTGASPVKLGAIVGAADCTGFHSDEVRSLNRYRVVAYGIPSQTGSRTDDLVIIESLNGKKEGRACRPADVWSYQGCAKGLCIGQKTIDKDGYCGKVVGVSSSYWPNVIIDRGPSPYGGAGGSWQKYIRKERNEVQPAYPGAECKRY